MAAFSIFPIVPGPNQGKNTHPTEVNAVQSTPTFKRGAVVISTSGLITEATTAPTSGIVGITCDQALNPDGSNNRDTADSIVRYLPVSGDEVFEGTFANNGAAVALAQTDLYTAYGLTKDSSGVWYVDKNVTSTSACAVIVGFKGTDDGTATIGQYNARVYFKIKKSMQAVA